MLKITVILAAGPAMFCKAIGCGVSLIVRAKVLRSSAYIYIYSIIIQKKTAPSTLYPLKVSVKTKYRHTIA